MAVSGLIFDRFRCIESLDSVEFEQSWTPLDSLVELRPLWGDSQQQGIIHSERESIFRRHGKGRSACSIGFGTFSDCTKAHDFRLISERVCVSIVKVSISIYYS